LEPPAELSGQKVFGSGGITGPGSSSVCRGQVALLETRLDA
jgi:hypothetical protein